MKTPLFFALACALIATAPATRAATAAGGSPYQVVKAARVGGAGGFDYVYADAESRRLYIPRGNRVTVFDLDSLAPAGEIANTANVHGVAVDPASHHGFSSSKPVVMWDTRTLATIKTIDVSGNPDGILFEPASKRVYVLSHRAPNVTVLDANDGSIAGTIDLGGAPEQAASDGKGRVFIDLEDRDSVAVVDANSLRVTAKYDLQGKGGTPAGLALDAANRLLFVCCRTPATCVVLNADTGKIVATLPIGSGTDGAVFNPQTGEVFSSQRDGTLTVIKELSPEKFAVEQTVATKVGAKTLTLDPKTNRILLITAEQAPAAEVKSAEAKAASGEAVPSPRGGRGGNRFLPDSFTILVVARS
jgi:DNA-binding beta-propeller fold protein YncE